MSIFKSPINRDDYPAIDKVQPVTPIEKDKKEDTSFNSGQDQKSKHDEIRTFLIVTLSKFIEKVFEKVPGRASSKKEYKESNILRELSNFKELLISLTIHDRSHEMEFLNNLSITWQNILESIETISPTDLTPEAPFIPYQEIADFSDELMNYPNSSDHSLGYYFTENVGKEWIPFPLMKMLQILHEDFQKNNKSSQLSDWIHKIDKITSQIT